jgi:3D (Asp-Asp-Asp) domain-containing protein
MPRGLACAALAVFGCIGAEIPPPPGAPAKGPVDPTLRPPVHAPDAALGTFQLTYYWVTDEADYTGALDTDLYAAGCSPLARVATEFARSLALEGTGRLVNGRVLNYSGPCDCAFTPCFYEVDGLHPWGVGVEDRPLVPFRSIAVDPTQIAIGERVYVAELDGVRMPGAAPWGGFLHDGCVVADDRGGAILGRHVDFFAALRDDYVDLDRRIARTAVSVYAAGARCP